MTAETLAAVLFVQEQILAAGRRVRYLGEAAKTFLSNWESEKYRKSLSGRG